ncbi:ABC transporter permease [Bacillus alkalicellulosilyticus]|uniref:ABC transporter permease n=1 Tax=Alkalihalobacterium alkalicellulosilyticum TaxID=1912214 RepID=UPI000998CED8|nr:ABC transporter permease [Bacillus alkalicellulosilyticus]
MYKVVIRKIAEALITLFCATLLIFVLIHLSPGDPVTILLGQPTEMASSDTQAYEDRVKDVRYQLGLDQTLPIQYLNWITRLVHFDLGTSIHTGRSVSSELAERLPATILLSISALSLQVAVGLIFGVASARRSGKTYDNLIRVFCVILASTPAFVIGLGLLSLLAVTFTVYDISNEASMKRLWLPALTLGFIGAPQLIRVVRANMLAELGQLYVLSGLSRGLENKLVIKHAVRNALLPVVTMVGLSLVTLVSGAVVIESIYSWPGIGKYALDSILLHDYPVIQGYAFIMVSVVILINVGVDVVYALVDPRVAHNRKVGNEKYV